MNRREIIIKRILGMADDFDFRAVLGGVTVGTARALLDVDHLLLCHIQIDDQYQGHGIGSRLLQHFLNAADDINVREIRGSILPKHFTPRLQTWYERHGFVVSEPDADCMKNAVKKIMRVQRI
jgi:GNAT superfamily N-acetyltransferase